MAEQWRNTAADRLPVAGALVEVKGVSGNTELARYLIVFSIHGMRGWVKFDHSNHLNFVPTQWRYLPQMSWPRDGSIQLTNTFQNR